MILHGWTLDHQVMLHALEPVFEKQSGWKRIYIDLPGMGRSQPHPSIQSSDEMLEAVLRLLDEMIPDEQFIVCGYSYGGYIARGIVHSRRETVRGLLLVAPMTIPVFDKRVVPEKTVLKSDSHLISHLSSEEADAFCSMAVVQGKRNGRGFAMKFTFLLNKQIMNSSITFFKMGMAIPSTFQLNFSIPRS